MLYTGYGGTGRCPGRVPRGVQGGQVGTQGCTCTRVAQYRYLRAREAQYRYLRAREAQPGLGTGSQPGPARPRYR